MRRKLTLAVLAAGAALAATVPAQAAQGCGPGFHRNGWGHCRPNGPGWGPGPAFAPGVWRPGHGYWYNNRYWHHRHWWRGGWRYY